MYQVITSYKYGKGSETTNTNKFQDFAAALDCYTGRVANEVRYLDMMDGKTVISLLGKDSSVHFSITLKTNHAKR